jgi:hypothetical protein
VNASKGLYHGIDREKIAPLFDHGLMREITTLGLKHSLLGSRAMKTSSSHNTKLV